MPMIQGRLKDALNIADLRELARRRLPKGIFAYLERGVEDDLCLATNRVAFQKIKLVPRILRDVSAISLNTRILGENAPAPFAIAPTGGNGLLWYRGDLELARAAAAAKLPFTISTASTMDVEEIAKAGGRLWFQLYMWRDRPLSHRALERAWSAGCRTLFLTADMPVSPNREFMRRFGYGVPFRINHRNALDVLTHPRWSLGVLGRQMMSGGAMRQANLPEKLKSRVTEAPSRKAPFKNDDLDWEEVKALRDRWQGAFVIKGILHPQDAETAIAIGADGLVVSNHGGRSMDCSVAAIDALPAVARAVQNRTFIFLDSGILRGTDIVKALALGANAVLIGRAALYGLAVAGERGAHHAMEMLRDEVSRTMAMTGSRTVGEITGNLLARPD